MSKKILIVEDNPQNMRLIEMALSAESYIMLEATTGEEALEIAPKELPDLIIMDIQLPQMNGLDVTRKLREMPELSQTPIIAITAYAMQEDEKKALDAGCSAYLTKPIKARELPTLIAEMLL